jgi:hypothetical protein
VLDAGTKAFSSDGGINLFDVAYGRGRTRRRGDRDCGAGPEPLMRGLDDAGMLVSGGSCGIGPAAAHRFLERGSRVFVSSGHHGVHVFAPERDIPFVRTSARPR